MRDSMNAMCVEFLDSRHRSAYHWRMGRSVSQAREGKREACMDGCMDGCSRTCMPTSV